MIRAIVLSALMVILGGTAFIATSCAVRTVYVRKAPPPPRKEMRPARPSAKAVWVTGYWLWNGNAYVWNRGYWEKRPKGRVWIAGHWRNTPRGYKWIPGHWK
ncbi:MAG: hypothetical protein DWQ05_00255 [Calditrichaeota bacterium]|nr:MAG: hypothetical protein DWQ05_00255 [Calditrichota bacterium]